MLKLSVIVVRIVPSAHSTVSRMNMQQYYRSQNADLDELGCPKNVVISKMQTGEIVTLMLGIFAILMTITIVVYYRYCKKNQYSTSRTVKMHQRHYVPK
ncbi:hypothetical protein QR680_001361 [Steinernema hermaphroditum]|uniref:Uncharacterized protein n=1 Tax=Steinernema hermaphroditum TaxID=289476 RepID=A0AA39GXZ6_9BILA|nr:hypothetical protein QR680_001361 [Steinernema hermaphroditum]